MNRVVCLVAAAFGVVLLPMTGSAQLPREGTEVDSESASGARTSVDGEGVEPAERRRRAPDILEDFSTYASTEEMLSDPRGIYRVQEDFYTGGPNAGGDAGSIVLDTSGGYAGRTQAMCYRWSAQRAPQAGGSISRWMALPDVKEVWIEWSVRFSRNFTVANGFTGGAAYKLLFLNIPNPPSGRVGVGMEGADGAVTMNGPDDVIEVSHRNTRIPLIGRLNDGRWHLFRIHARLGGSSDLIELWVDGARQTPSQGWNSAADRFIGITLGKNMNMAPRQAQENCWGHVAVWTSNPDG